MGALKLGFAQMLEGIEFDYFGTFTQRTHMTEKMARRYAYTLYQRCTVRATGGGTFFWAAEQHKQGSYHIHALFNSGLTKADINREWNRLSMSREQKEEGDHHYVRVLDYDKNLGGGGYVSKYVVKSLVDWDIHVFKPNILDNKGNIGMDFAYNRL